MRVPTMSLALCVALFAPRCDARAAEDGPRLSAADDKPITVINAADGSRREDAGNPYGMGIYRMDGVGGPCVRLCRSPTTATGSPDLSRDGKRIAFDGWQAHESEDFSDARIYTFAVSTPTEITDMGRAAMPSWAPGAVGLVYSSYQPNGIYLMDADGGGRTRIDSGWSAEWSPDGSKIAYTWGDRLTVYNVLTGEKKGVPKESSLSRVWHGITWSPDSQAVCVRATDDDARKIVLAVIETEGDNPTHRVISGRVPDRLLSGLDTPIAWGGDGKRVMFPANNPEVGLAQLFTLDASGDSEPEVVPGLPESTHCTQPYWSPDGTIVFVGTPVDGAAGGE